MEKIIENTFGANTSDDPLMFQARRRFCIINESFRLQLHSEVGLQILQLNHRNTFKYFCAGVLFYPEFGSVILS